MLYIKKIVAQDIKKEFAIQFGPSKDFLHMKCIQEINADTQKPQTYKFFIKTESEETINTEIHYNYEKKECRLKSELKNYLSKISFEVDDILVFQREETTETTGNSFFSEIRLLGLFKKSDDKYNFFNSILQVNSRGRKNKESFCCVSSDTEDENKTDKNTILERNIIFYGAPGTGKSTAVNKIIEEQKLKLFRTTFHPESDYFSFFGSYKPSSDLPSGKIIYKFTPQIFLKAYLYAWQHPEEKVCLDIEEINRGNCAQIFGDIFQLLDRKDSGFSTYIVDADEDCGIFIKNEFDKLKDATGNNPITEKYKEKVCCEGNISKEEFVFSKLLLPNNLYIFATMNTSDQSLYPMDSAFKRRWAWKYVPINYDEVKDKFVVIRGTKYSWTDFLLKVNKRIESITQSEDKKLGQYFIGQDKDEITEEEFRDKVLFYLWNDIFKDEFGTGTTIFKTINSADNSKVECFSFSDLFNRDASVLIEDIMKNLAVEAFSKKEKITEQADKDSSEGNTDNTSAEKQQEDSSEQQS